MLENIQEFNASTKSEWLAQLQKDLKDKPLDSLMVSDEIEEIHLPSYQHQEDHNNELGKPGLFPYERGMTRTNNQWRNGLWIAIEDEKSANKEALDWLMKGVDCLVFNPTVENINWSQVFDGIGLEFIHTHIEGVKFSDLEQIKTILSGEQWNHISFSFQKEDVSTLLDYLKQQQFKAFQVDAFQLQQCGSAAYQELAFALFEGHNLLLQLMEGGLTIDEACACLHFKFGISANYLLESTKIKVFRQLWSQVLSVYEPKHNCSYNTEITSYTGFTNKSLKDSYTNILRQTTEALSAINGGASNVVVLPYDSLASEQSELAKRMAVNISLLLAEEAHLDKVIDPLGGSYVDQALSKQLSELSWKAFLDLENDAKNGEISVAIANLVQAVSIKRDARIERIQSGKQILIGINKFPNPEQSSLKWTKEINTTLAGIKPLILEKELSYEKI